VILDFYAITLQAIRLGGHEFLIASNQRILELSECKAFVDSQDHKIGSPPVGLYGLFRQTIDKYQGWAEEHLLSSLMKAPSAASEDFRDGHSAGPSKILLATSVFVCPACLDNIVPCLWLEQRALIGWKDIGPHMDCRRQSAESSDQHQSTCSIHVIASTDGILAARELVRLLGLDQETAQAAELDHLDRRFFCNNCPLVEPKGGVKGRHILRWRECVSSLASCSSTSK